LTNLPIQEPSKYSFRVTAYTCIEALEVRPTCATVKV
jgi:hypothetical protein